MGPCPNPAAWSFTSGDFTMHSCDDHVADALRHFGIAVMCYPVRSSTACGLARKFPAKPDIPEGH